MAAALDPKALANGQWLKTERGAQRHKFNTFCSLQNKTDVTWVKQSGEINGNSIALASLKNCKVYICDFSEQVTIDDCEDCEIVIGACASTVFMRNCKNCKIHAACKQLMLHSSSFIQVKLFCLIGPQLENSTDVKIGYFNTKFPLAYEAWTRAGLYPFPMAKQREYSKVNDCSVDVSKSVKNFTVERSGTNQLDMTERVPGLAQLGPSSNPLFAKFPVGQRVKAQFGGKRKWFRGVISKSPNQFGKSYSVAYDDGDSEDRVDKDLIRVFAPPLQATFDSTKAVISCVLDAAVGAVWERVGARVLMSRNSEEFSMPLGDGSAQWSCRVLHYDADLHGVVVEATDADGTTHVSLLKLWPVTTDNKTFVEWVADFPCGTPQPVIEASKGKMLGVLQQIKESNFLKWSGALKA